MKPPVQVLILLVEACPYGSCVLGELYSCTLKTDQTLEKGNHSPRGNGGVNSVCWFNAVIVSASSRARCTARPNPNVGVWRRERFIAGPCKGTGGSCSKKPPSSQKGFNKAFCKSQVRERGSQGM